jgi:hypothetical protein
MMDKTIFPEDYQPDASRLVKMYRDDALYVWNEANALVRNRGVRVAAVDDSSIREESKK